MNVDCSNDDDVQATENKLECPFTWVMDENLAQTYEQDAYVNIEDQPIKALMHSITLIYVHVIKKDLHTAYAKVKETIEVLNSMDFPQLEKEGISIKILVHIVRASQYHYYVARGNHAGAQKILAEVPLLDAQQLRDKTNIGTLNGCKSLSWSVFFDAPKSIALAYASRAVQNSPNCALWNFILGKKIRHLRRDDSNFEPLPDEIKHLLKAYELSGSHYYGVFVAQMYGEMKEYGKAKQISMEIYNCNPQSVGIRLRLALNFMKSKDYDYAKDCLDFVQIRCVDNSMYLHYKGLYFEKQKNYQMAALYYSKGAEKGNYKADLQYAKCMSIINKKFNYVKHLDEMLTRHNKNTTLVQQIFLHTAMQFYFIKIDIKNALTYFLKAIQISPKNKQLKNYKNITMDYKTYNIVEFLYNKILPETHQKYPILPYDLSDVINTIEKLYPLCSTDGNSLSSNVENMEL
ncbi:uncharacterized protein LOC106646639 [Copidosoma floridanum]|uniref:uncharacterized protein LOC106646639 n=1 Tax=Copidosoma floridanum TaxID=29053 RepID=UPI0006C980B6|nr:uncharacterized protein LOC106646639 [Copidosoma floridanum]